MKIKLLGAAILACALPAVTQAVTITSGFGTPPGMPANGYGGTGIPINASQWVEASGLPGGDTLTIGLAATPYGPVNPALGNNGAGTYFATTGLVGGRSTWNFDFYLHANNGFTPYNITFTELNVGNGLSFSFNPFAIPDNVPSMSTTTAGNSESLDFSVFGAPIGYNPLVDGTFVFTVTATDGVTTISDSITVITGQGASVPDGGATGLMLGAGLVGVLGLRRKF